MPVEYLTNERIIARTVRIVEDSVLNGLVPLNTALDRARSLGLDLVMVSMADTPICRIVDADRFRYERSKADREQARRQRELSIEVKEIQLRPVTNANDLGIKARRARGFLDEGDKVKVVLRFKGRERTHKECAHDVIRAFLEAVGDYRLDKPLGDGGGDMMLILAPMVSKSELLRARESAESSQQEP